MTSPNALELMLLRFLRTGADALDAWMTQQAKTAAQLDRMEKMMVDISAEEATLAADEAALVTALDDLATKQAALLAEVAALESAPPAMVAAAAALEGATARVTALATAATPAPAPTTTEAPAPPAP